MKISFEEPSTEVAQKFAKVTFEVFKEAVDRAAPIDKYNQHSSLSNIFVGCLMIIVKHLEDDERNLFIETVGRSLAINLEDIRELEKLEQQDE